MSTADEQIRVSAETKRELERRKREGESFEDVLERLLKDDRDLLAGFGSWSGERAEKAREVREKGREKSKNRMRRIAREDEGS
jgi:predicted CopG family antitoxin